MARTRTVEKSVVGPPAGIYVAEVDKLEDGIDGQFGSQVKFYFVIKKVLHSNDDNAIEWVGKEKWAWASDLLTQRSKLFKWSKQILDNPGLSVDDDIDLDDLEGRLCTITISSNDEDVLTVSDVAAYRKPKSSGRNSAIRNTQTEEFDDLDDAEIDDEDF